VVRRVKDARYPEALFPVWRYHPFLMTNSELPTVKADIVHRRHAVIETVFADLIDGPLAHLPSGRFGANSAWVLCAGIAHNLLRAAGTLAGDRHAVACGATLRRRIVSVPATRAQTRPASTPPLALGNGMASAVATRQQPRLTSTRLIPTPSVSARGRHQWKSWADQQLPHASEANTEQQT
jgi:hypothetical protein